MAMTTSEPTPFRKRREEHPENLLKSADGRVPPHDLDAEAAVLSACFVRGASAVDEVSQLLSPEDFYAEAHRRIFEASVDLAGRGQPVDMVTVGSLLKEKGRLQQVGGVPYMAQIADAAPAITTPSLQAYATTVRNRARLRRLAYQLAVAQARCYGPLTDVEAEEFFAGVEQSISDICAARQKGDLEKVGPIVTDVLKDFDDHAKRGGGIAGISTGFERFDLATGGLHEGDLTIVAARPGMGKTALVMGVCDNVTDRGYAGFVFSLEMPKKQLVQRLLCTRGRVDLAKTRLGTFSATDWNRLTQAGSEVFPKDIYIDDQPDQALSVIRAKIRRHLNRLNREGKKLGVVIIDYLQLMKVRVARGENRAVLIGEITRGFKSLAKELRVPILLLAQLNREVEKREDKRPMPSDLRDSGEIEQDADNVVFIYRDDHYFEDSEDRNVAEIIISKQRNGPTGVVKLRFDKQWTRFDNIGGWEPEHDGIGDGEPYERGELYRRSDGSDER